ncbi:hypothetical protein CFO_g3344 [Ceratocystis platani]|uniref:Uncharacterized protein n=1 Tax=Ceratocystis fimbriata f. sp. platani TaxID=88771 RepID=A0A0F8CUB2_CERFI|nr:hypothetical protein CFO_g3344 [Ceratocystis platani]
MGQNYDNLLTMWPSRYLVEFNNVLSQVPLTVSPFVKLPSAPTLSYNYTKLPSVLPTSRYVAGNDATSATAAGPSTVPYVGTRGGHFAHPQSIIRSCTLLREHLDRLQAEADRELEELNARIADAELAEKRRIAPGWLDSENHILVPESAAGKAADDAGKSEPLDLASEPTEEQRRKADAEADEVSAFVEMLSLKEKQKTKQ